MTIKQLNIDHFRSITNARLAPGPHLNLFVGPNGSGKTSLLEAIYFLGRGKSFKSNLLSKIVQRGQTQFVLYTGLQDEPPISIGIQKSTKQSTVKLNGDVIHTSSMLAHYLPLLLIHPESHHLLEQGPKQRRHFMNWGLFHVEQSFLPLWNNFLHILKQRNALIRRQDQHTLPIWNQKLADVSEQIDQLRQTYIQAIEAPFQTYCAQLLNLQDIQLVYKKGWDKERRLLDILTCSVAQDFASGFTRFGPHRADIALLHEKKNIHQIVSRGQQKLVITALLLAQAKYLSEHCGKKAILLVDDITSELDNQHLKRLYQTLLSTQAQLFVTTVSEHLLQHIDLPENHCMFHVEHGEITATSNCFSN